MKHQRSFRTNLLFGSLLWTAGILAFTHMATTFVIHNYPNYLPVAHWTGLSVVALALIIGGVSQIKRGISPFDQLRERLSAVRDGKAPRVEGSYPTEVQPLVNDLNALLDHRELAVKRAQAKAGDLAHGLKTPLAVIFQEADLAQASGHAEFATRIRQQVERMQRQIEYHLAHARAAASGATPGSRCSVHHSADGIVRTLQRLYEERGLRIDVNVNAKHQVRVQREDLDEMLGNLVENACKWAQSKVVMESSESGGRITIQIDDDGPGLPADMREAVLQRGVRADEVAPGSGLGLAIVRDLAELYGGSITLDVSPQGGVRATLLLPIAQTGMTRT